MPNHGCCQGTDYSPGMAEMRKIAPHLGGPAATFEYEDEPS